MAYATAHVPHVPVRRCRVCRTAAPKAALVRWTVPSGQPAIDEAQTAPGRGYYSCNTDRCRDILPKTIKSAKKA